jgi:hypothetical protein
MKKTKEVSSALLFAFFLFFQTQRERERKREQRFGIRRKSVQRMRNARDKRARASVAFFQSGADPRWRAILGEEK